MVEQAQLPQEIERKFLVKHLPENWQQFPHQEIQQGYIVLTSDGLAIRLRQQGEKFFHTIKSGVDSKRIEIEIELDKNTFNHLWELTKGHRLEKTRYEIPFKQYAIELDVYKNRLEGLLTTEVEFKSENERDQFSPPDWFGEEVTGDPHYTNQNLALNGLPS